MKKDENELIAESSSKPVYTKHQILDASLFTPLEKDVLSAVLIDNMNYTLDKAKELIDEFGKGEAK